MRIHRLENLVGIIAAGFMVMMVMILLPHLISAFEIHPLEWRKLTKWDKIELIGSFLLFLIIMVSLSYLLISTVWRFLT